MKICAKCLALKGAAGFMKKLEILSIPEPKDVLKLRLARTISSSVISEKEKVSDPVLLLYAPSMSICHPPRDNDSIPIADWLDRFGGQNKS